MHKIEITDQQLSTLRDALLIAFKNRFEMAEQFAKSPDLQHIAPAVRDKAHEFDDLRTLLLPMNLKSN